MHVRLAALDAEDEAARLETELSVSDTSVRERRFVLIVAVLVVRLVCVVLITDGTGAQRHVAPPIAKLISQLYGQNVARDGRRRGRQRRCRGR